MSLQANENAEGSAQTPSTDSSTLPGGAVSFDELAAMDAVTPEPAASEEAPAATEEKPVEEAAPKKEGEPEKTPPTKEELAEKLKAGQQEKKDLDKTADKVKTYKVKSGESEVQVRADAAFDVTVAGKAEKVPLQELINNYAGKTDWNRKYTEMDKERQAFHKDRDTVQGVVNSFLDTAPKDPMTAITQLGEASGFDMEKFWDDFTNQLDGLWGERMALSPEERKARDLERKVERYQKRDESAKQTAARTKSLEAEKQKVKQLQETHGLNDEKFHELYSDLQKHGIAEKDLTPELVVDYHQELTARQTLRGILTEVNPGLKDPGKAIDQLRSVQRENPNLSVQDLKDIVVEVYGDKTAQNLSKKIKKAAPTDTLKPPKARREEPISFDDLN